MDDLHCGPHSLTFESGSDTASVNIPLVNDNVQECDEMFTAYLILGDGGNSTSEGFRLGHQSSTSITIMDEGNHDFPQLGMCIVGPPIAVMHGSLSTILLVT